MRACVGYAGSDKNSANGEVNMTNMFDAGKYMQAGRVLCGIQHCRKHHSPQYWVPTSFHFARLSFALAKRIGPAAPCILLYDHLAYWNKFIVRTGYCEGTACSACLLG